MLNQLDNLGNLTVGKLPQYKPKRMLLNDKKVKSTSQVNIKLQDDIDTPEITSCEVFPNG